MQVIVLLPSALQNTDILWKSRILSNENVNAYAACTEIDQKRIKPVFNRYSEF